MRKLSNILKESIDIEEMEDYVLTISDTLGVEPSKKLLGTEKFTVYQFEWELGFKISEFNAVSNIDKVIKCLTSIKQLGISNNRMENAGIEFNIDFKINNKLCVILTPKTNELSGNYNFITGQEWRMININYIEVLRFFKERGCTIIDAYESDAENDDNSHVTITTNATNEITAEFCNLFNAEEKSKKLDREILASSGGPIVSIDPVEEKTYVVLINKL